MALDVALLYNRRDRGIHGRHWKLNNYRFFRDELPRQVNFKEYPIWRGFDCSRLKCDVAILFSILRKNLAGMKLEGFKGLDCVKVTRAPDAWQIDDEYNRTAKEIGIDLVMSFQSPNCQYDFLDKTIPYKRYILGIDEVTYKNPDNWDERRQDRILSSGVLSVPYHPLWFYYFRTECTYSRYVEHVPKGHYLGVDYWKLLTQYRAAIACMSYTSVLKYFEIPMCGCLMFAEVTEKNQISDMGFIDGVNCVYIDKNNYEDRFQEFVEDFNNPKWKRIAETGHKLVKNTYNNRKQVREFVQALESMVSTKTK